MEQQANKMTGRLEASLSENNVQLKRRRIDETDEDLSVEDKWLLNIRPIILKILHQESISEKEWQGVFRCIHSACIWGEDDPTKVHEALKGDILEHTKQARTRIVNHSGDEAFLKAYTTEWDRFFTQSKYIEKPFHMLKLKAASFGSGKIIYSSYYRSQHKLSLVQKLMLDLWKETIFADLKERLECSTVRLIKAELNGEAFDSQLMIKVRQSYVNLSSDPDDKLAIYRENFEKFYLEAVESFYRVKALEYQGAIANNLASYLRYADEKLNEEEKRERKYLVVYGGSSRISTESCAKILVTPVKEIILEQCTPMIISKDYENLQLIVRVLDRVTGGLEPVLGVVEEYLRKYCLTSMRGMKATDFQDHNKYAEHLIDLFKRCTHLVNAFANDQKLLSARDKAFKCAINDPIALNSEVSRIANETESKCPELLAKFCDSLLRKTTLSNKLGSEGVGNKLAELLQVLKYVENEYVFMKCHKVHLTRRLILGTCANYENEELLQRGLEDIGMPFDCVNKLGRMFKDIKVSEDGNQRFKEMNTTLFDSISVKILNSFAWSDCGSISGPMALPTELKNSVLKMEQFFRPLCIGSGRKLRWQHHLSHGTITYTNQAGKFDLDVTTYQMSVLFAWNERPNNAKITFEDLLLATELIGPELRRALWSLISCPRLKLQILVCSGDVKTADDFENNTLFEINRKFAIIQNGKPRMRGKVNLIGRLQLTTKQI